MIRAIRIINLRRLVKLRLRTAIAIVAVAAGTSLGLGVFIVVSSISRSLSDFSSAVAGPATLRVVGASNAGALTGSTLRAVKGTPGVRSVAPIIEAATELRFAAGSTRFVAVLGVDCRAVAFTGFPCPAGVTELPGIFVSATLGQRLRTDSWLETNVSELPLSNALRVRALDGINQGDVVVVPLALAQQVFARPGAFDVIYVTPQPGVSTAVLQARLERSVGPANGVLTATAEPPEVAASTASFVPLLALLALLASGIAGVLVYNVINLSLEERRREYAITAAIGAPPEVLVFGPLSEAAVLGAVGGLLGALGGWGLAYTIVGTLSDATEHYAGVPIEVHAAASTIVIGLVLGMVIALLATIRPVRRASRLDVVAELTGRGQRVATATKRRLKLALTVSAITGAAVVLTWLGDRHGGLAAWQPPAAIVGFLGAAVVGIIVIAAWAPIVIRGVSTRLRERGVIGVALTNLVQEPGRTGVMTVAVAAAVTVAFITGSYQRSVGDDISSGFHQSLAASALQVTPTASADGSNIDALVPSSAASTLADLPGVARVDSVYLDLAGHSTGQLVLVEATSRLDFESWTVYEGTASKDKFDFGEVVVGAGLARRDKLSPGSVLRLETPRGLARLEVQGVWGDGSLGGLNVTMPAALEQRYFGIRPPSGLALLPAHGSSASTLEAEAEAAHLPSFLTYRTPQVAISKITSSATTQISPFWALQRGLLFVSFVTLLSTLLLVGLQRRREFGLLAAVGLTPGELFEMVVVEALAIGVVGAVLGVVMGAVLMEALLNAVPIFVGFQDTYVLDPGAALLYGPLAVVVAAAASLWPGWRAARIPVIEALAYE